MPRTFRLRSERGFTLIEAIMMMALLAVLTVTALQKVRLSPQKLDATAKLLRSNIQFAQELAMTYGASYGFHALNSTHYEIFSGAAGTPATNPLDQSSFIVDMSPVQFVGTPPTITFLRTGKPDLTADVAIGISEEGNARTLTVTMDTGVVTLSP